MDPYYYRVLGVERNATHREVQAAYRRLAKLYHPDINKSPGAAEMFIKIQKAWDVLGDSEKRADYDNYSLRYSRNVDYSTIRKPPPPTDRMYRPYVGYGGRVYYRATNPETFQREQKIRKRDMLAGLAAILLILMIPVAGMLCKRVMISTGGVETYAIIDNIDDKLIVSFNHQNREVTTEYEADIFVCDGEPVVVGGMPLQIGDKFYMKYLKHDNTYLKLYFGKPDIETLDRYCADIYKRWGNTTFLDSLRQGAMQAAFTYVLCDSLYYRYGVHALASFYYAKTQESINPYQNEKTWKNLTKLPGWDDLLANCRKLTSPMK